MEDDFGKDLPPLQLPLLEMKDDENIVDFLQDYDMICEANEWGPDMKLFMLVQYLTGDPKAFFDDLYHKGEVLTWDQAKKLLIDKFGQKPAKKE